MRIRIVSPAKTDSLAGNNVTSQRWRAILESGGQKASIGAAWDGESCDVLVALHAWKSADSIRRFAQASPHKPVIVALTGTDVYGDLKRVRESLRLAARMIVLQPLAMDRVPRTQRHKVRVVYQSAEPVQPKPRRRRDVFVVCVAGHLRKVKDPFRTALASRRLPAGSRIRVEHYGEALDQDVEARARTEEKLNPRYRWFGPLPRHEFRRRLAASHLLVISSRMEGGANVVSEALVDGVPVLASRVPGNVGLLGTGYPGYFHAGSTTALAGLLNRAERDRAFYRELKTHCRRQARLFRRAAERRAWRDLLAEISGPSTGAAED